MNGRYAKVFFVLLAISFFNIVIFIFQTRPFDEDPTIFDVTNDKNSFRDNYMESFFNKIEILRNKNIIFNDQLNRTLQKLHSFEDFKILSPELSLISLPILILACNRPSVERTLNQVVQLRSSFVHNHSAALLSKQQLPIFVSQDCVHEETRRVLDSFLADQRVQQVWHQPDQSAIPMPHNSLSSMQGYYRIARHYRWALDKVLVEGGFSQVVVLEDDLDVAADLLEYFWNLAPLLSTDASLWCISAWNDNGKAELIDEGAADKIYRSDFFPGLGWMLTKTLWLELREKWPRAFWDDFMRENSTRQGRQCLRPEISRTFTFGRLGISNGQFYDSHLQHIRLNQRFVDFSVLRPRLLEELKPENYNARWNSLIYQLSTNISYNDFISGNVVPTDLSGNHSYVILYSSPAELEVLLKKVNAMHDLKAGVARTSFQGVVTVFYRSRRFYFAPFH